MAIIPPIAATGTTPFAPIRGIDPAPRGTGGADPTSAAGFGEALTSALDRLDATTRATDSLARDAATGKLERVEDLMAATAETQLATQLTVAVRNRALEAFTEIMRMQV